MFRIFCIDKRNTPHLFHLTFGGKDPLTTCDCLGLFAGAGSKGGGKGTKAGVAVPEQQQHKAGGILGVEGSCGFKQVCMCVCGCMNGCVYASV